LKALIESEATIKVLHFLHKISRINSCTSVLHKLILYHPSDTLCPWGVLPGLTRHSVPVENKFPIGLKGDPRPIQTTNESISGTWNYLRYVSYVKCGKWNSLTWNDLLFSHGNDGLQFQHSTAECSFSQSAIANSNHVRISCITFEQHSLSTVTLQNCDMLLKSALAYSCLKYIVQSFIYESLGLVWGTLIFLLENL